MEVAGLVVGVVALAGMASTVIDFTDHVTLVKNHGKDFGDSVAQSRILGCRMQLFYELMQLGYEDDALPALRSKWSEKGPSGQTFGETMYGGLSTLSLRLKDAHTLEKEYGVKVTSADESREVVKHIPGLKYIDRAFGADKRQKEVSTIKKSYWAIHDKKKFDGLLATMNNTLDGLEKLYESMNLLARQQNDMKLLVGKVNDEEAIKLLERAEQTMQNTSSSASAGHKYFGTIIGEQAKVIAGNVDSNDATKHEYRDTRIWGKADVILGNVDGTASRSFFSRSKPQQ